MPALDAEEFTIVQDGRHLRLTLRSGEAAMSCLLTQERTGMIRDAFQAHARTLEAATAALRDAANRGHRHG